MESPIIRVGILEHQDQVSIEPVGPFFVITKDPRPQKRIKETGVWTARILSGQSASWTYRIRFYESGDKARAQKRARELEKQNIATELVTRGEALFVSSDVIADARSYAVYHPRFFESRSRAEWALAQLSVPSAQVVERVVKRGRGRIQLCSPSGKTIEADDVLRFSGPLIRVKRVEDGAGFHWHHQEDRTYRGEIEVSIDQSGHLSVINVLPLETYLKGVLPREMSSTFPPEALKAQAIASRTFVLYHFGSKHPNSEYDVCDNVHCQAYAGITRESQRTNDAVDDTRGMVLMHRGELCLTPYSAICGGHTETAENIWNSERVPYLTGGFDVPSSLVPRQFDLTDANHVRTWIRRRPRVFCNVDISETPIANYARKYFRWTVHLAGDDLRKRIQSRFGRDIGTILSLIPEKRSVSGRITQLRITGTNGSVRVQGELKIRQTLSASTLYSSCFLARPDNNRSGFVLEGAGWGHGVGMCQIGAAVMAQKEYDVTEILNHYYPGTHIQQLY